MKRLVFCFDGTWNKLDAPFPTNVVLTAESVIPLTKDGTAQLIYYDEGVGTRWYDKYIGGIFGAGLLRNLVDAYRFLIFNYRPGDEIYVLGFSRGAYSARSFVGLLRQSAIVNRRIAGKITDAIKNYKRRETDANKLAEIRNQFRNECSFDVCVSAEEEDWLVRNVPNYKKGDRPRLRVKYVGVWDTVGALGVPGYFKSSPILNRRYQFHDLSLSGEFVESARHAVAIDEHRQSFIPTLWDNIKDLNDKAATSMDDPEAPYQQKWFPGTHGSVGGGGDRRGLSDQAMSWILAGAKKKGLELDSKEGSRIFELDPDHKEHLFNASYVSIKDRIEFALMRKADRKGPQFLYEVNTSARRRWLDSPENLSDKKPYRPKTLELVVDELDKLDAKALGVGPNANLQPKEDYFLHDVKPRETLWALAKTYYDDPNKSSRIHQANLHIIDDPNLIYAGDSLRIPKEGATSRPPDVK